MAQVLLMTLQNAPPGLDYDRDKRFSKVVVVLFVNAWAVNAFQFSGTIFMLVLVPVIIYVVWPLCQTIVFAFLMEFFSCNQSFKEMVAMCLVKDQTKRPTAEKLLKHSFFKNAKPPELTVKSVLTDLPPLWDRVKALQVCFYVLSSCSFSLNV